MEVVCWRLIVKLRVESAPYCHCESLIVTVCSSHHKDFSVASRPEASWPARRPAASLSRHPFLVSRAATTCAAAATASPFFVSSCISPPPSRLPPPVSLPHNGSEPLLGGVTALQQDLHLSLRRVSVLTKDALRHLELSDADKNLRLITARQSAGEKAYSTAVVNPNVFSASRWRWIWTVNQVVHRNRLTKLLREMTVL